MEAVLLIWVTTIIGGTLVGASKGRATLGFLMTTFFAVFGLALIFFAEAEERCPTCSGRNRVRTATCWHCGHDLRPYHGDR
jgi:hypothetical protein